MINCIFTNLFFRVTNLRLGLKKRKQSVLVCIFYLCLTPLFSQVQLVTSGLTSGGGYGSEEVLSTDFATGQLVSFPIGQEISGNVGILQFIPNLVSSANNPFKETIKIYPNPTIDYLNIVLPCEEKFDLSISTIDSKIIFQHTDKSCPFSMDLSNMHPGTYLLTISNQHQLSTYKIILK